MKKNMRLPAVVFLVSAMLWGCATAPPAPRPRDPGGPIYDEQGRVIWQPMPRQKPAPVPTDQRPPVAIPPESGEPVLTEEDSYPPARVPDEPEPAPWIGSSDPSPAPEPEDDHLLAAVRPLEQQARQQMERGELDNALATAERAIRIDSDNPDLWNLMAQIQLERTRYTQAEQLARKSNLLAGNNRSLQADNWKIIAEALRRNGETVEAERALRRARELSDY